MLGCAAMHEGRLARELGVRDAVALGMGSILGTGVFVTLALAAGAAGPAVLVAVVLAGALAAANGLSSAQLAAEHPVSGGTYEYGYRLLAPWLGFTAGWMFLAAKGASAATAALGFAGYLLHLLGADGARRVPVALAAVALFTLLVAGGLRRSNRVNWVIVATATLSLAFFVLAGLPAAARGAPVHLVPFFAPQAGRGPLSGLLYATALVFVAYTGYGRIATLGEEVREPRRTIPRAIVATLLLTVILYAAVATVGTAVAGSAEFARAAGGEAAPLGVVAHRFAGPAGERVVAVGALAALLGVLLNLLLGLSRVVLAMSRRGDAPAVLARIDARRNAPRLAVVAVGVLVLVLAALGDVETTWSFSAFTVLVYYAVTNLAALRLPPAARRFPRWVAWAGLGGCLFLAFWVEPVIWGAGLALLAVGLAGHAVAARRRRAAS